MSHRFEEVFKKLLDVLKIPRARKFESTRTLPRPTWAFQGQDWGFRLNLSIMLGGNPNPGAQSSCPNQFISWWYQKDFLRKWSLTWKHCWRESRRDALWDKPYNGTVKLVMEERRSVGTVVEECSVWGKTSLGEEAAAHPSLTHFILHQHTEQGEEDDE